VQSGTSPSLLFPPFLILRVQVSAVFNTGGKPSPLERNFAAPGPSGDERALGLGSDRYLTAFASTTPRSRSQQPVDEPLDIPQIPLARAGDLGVHIQVEGKSAAPGRQQHALSVLLTT